MKKSMRKIFLVFTFLILAYCNIFAQTKEFKFTPKWKVGEKKFASFVFNQYEMKNGDSTIDSTSYYNFDFEIIKENNESYTLQIHFVNPVLRKASHFYDNIIHDLKNFKDIDLLYQVDKITGKSEIINFIEINHYMKKCLEQINKIMNKENSNIDSNSKQSILTLFEAYKNKENLEDDISREIGFLFDPFNKQFVIGDTLNFTQSSINPLDRKELTKQTKLFSMNKVDESKKTCQIFTSEDYDLENYKNMMIKMCLDNIKSNNSNSSTNDTLTKEIEKINIDFSYYSIIDFDYNTTWPTFVVTKGKISILSPFGTFKTSFEATVTIK